MRHTRSSRALQVIASMAVLLAATGCEQKHSKAEQDTVPSSAAEPSAQPASSPAIASGAIASGPAPSVPASTSSVASAPATSVSPRAAVNAEKPRAVPFDELDRVRDAVFWLYQTLEFDRAGEMDQYLSRYHPDAVLRVEAAPGGGKARQYTGEQAIAARRAQLKQQAFQSHQATIARALKDAVQLSFEYCYWPRGGVMDPSLVRCREESVTLRKDTEGTLRIHEHHLSVPAPGTEIWQQRLSLPGAHPQLALVRGPCRPKQPNFKFVAGECERSNALLVTSTTLERVYVDMYAATLTSSSRPEREFRLDDGQALIWRGNNMSENVDHRFNREGSTLEIAARYYDANEEPDAPFYPLATITLDSSEPIPIFCTNYEVRTLTPCHPERHAL